MKNQPSSQSHYRGQLSALKISGDNVRRERIARRMSREKLGLLADLDARTICEIEAGNLNLRQTTIERIQQVLGCPMIKLLEFDQKEAGPADTTLSSILKKLSAGVTTL